MTELKLQEDLRKYLCLRCAGFLEQVTHVILTSYLVQKSSGPILEFSKSSFIYAPNLRVNPFISLIGRFGNEKKSAFEKFLNSNRRDILSDLLEVRNDVAHGKMHGGRKLDPARYVAICEEVYDWLVENFLGDSVEVLNEEGKTVGYSNIGR
ncbi:HEPN domain-containing protein [Rhodococcus sp. NPDC019627]|uniref:HEPN domain-containing protein n=1 Tax=Rhodococcus TaxID=1827 RepID=UPI0011D09671|nr:HEPN domain-containing protein [Rhodococcus opacus]